MSLTEIEQVSQPVRAIHEHANPARIARSRAKEWIAKAETVQASRERAIEVLQDPSPDCAGMRVMDVLCAVRGVGPVWARHVLRHAQIYERKAISELTLRQALVLAGALQEGRPVHLGLRG